MKHRNVTGLQHKTASKQKIRVRNQTDVTSSCCYCKWRLNSNNCDTCVLKQLSPNPSRNEQMKTTYSLLIPHNRQSICYQICETLQLPISHKICFSFHKAKTQNAEHRFFLAVNNYTATFDKNKATCQNSKECKEHRRYKSNMAVMLTKWYQSTERTKLIR